MCPFGGFANAGMATGTQQTQKANARTNTNISKAVANVTESDAGVVTTNPDPSSNLKKIGMNTGANVLRNFTGQRVALGV